MTPDEIYIRAIAAERARPVVTDARYDVEVRAKGAAIGCPHGHIVVTFGSGNAVATYRVTYRGDGDATQSVDLATRASCIGVPLIEPGGGDVGKLVQSSDAPVPLETDSPNTKPIATVRAIGVAHYAVVSSNDESLAGRPVYHLVVRALTDAAIYPLTDLYVARSDYQIVRIIGHFVDRFGGAPATIVATGDFERSGAYAIEMHERVEFAADTQPERTRATLDATVTNLIVGPRPAL